MEPPASRIPRLGWVMAFLAVAIVIGAVYWQFRHDIQSRKTVAPLERIAPAPEFQMTAQDGRPVSSSDLKGKVWVANFIFTRCPGPCPVMTSRMAELNMALGAKAKDVQLVTFTVDPEYDTPKVLQEYGARAGAEPGKWKFLTGPKDQVDLTVTKGFLQALAPGPDGPIHSTRFVLVDRDGWMRSFRDGNDPEVVQKLLTDIGEILRE